MEWEGGGAPEAEFLDGIQTSVLWFFIPVIHSHLYSFALRFLFLQTHATSYSFSSVKEKGGKPDRKPYPLSCGLRNLKSKNSQDYAEKSQWNCRFMNSASGFIHSPFLYLLLGCGVDQKVVRRQARVRFSSRYWASAVKILEWASTIEMYF
jgi:hypothetical protein